MSNTAKIFWLALLGLLLALAAVDAEEAQDGTLRTFYAQSDTAHAFPTGYENVHVTYTFKPSGGMDGQYNFAGTSGNQTITLTNGVATPSSFTLQITTAADSYHENFALSGPTGTLVLTVDRTWSRVEATGDNGTITTLEREIPLRNPLTLPKELEAQRITSPTGGAWNNQKGIPKARIPLPQYGPQGISGNSSQTAQDVYDGVLAALRDSGGEYVPPYLEKVEIADGAYATENKEPLHKVYADTVEGISTVKSIKPSMLAAMSKGTEFDGLTQLGTVSSVVLGNITLAVGQAPFNVSVDLSPWQNLIAFFRACLNLGLLVGFVAKVRQLPEKFL